MAKSTRWLHLSSWVDWLNHRIYFKKKTVFSSPPLLGKQCHCFPAFCSRETLLPLLNTSPGSHNSNPTETFPSPKCLFWTSGKKLLQLLQCSCPKAGWSLRSLCGLAFWRPLFADLSLILQRTSRAVVWRAPQSGQSTFELALLLEGAVAMNVHGCFLYLFISLANTGCLSYLFLAAFHYGSITWNNLSWWPQYSL